MTSEKTVMAELQTKEDSLPPLMNSTEAKLFSERIFHSNFKKYFVAQDFDILIEYIILPDFDVLISRIENYVKRFNSYRMQEMSQ